MATWRSRRTGTGGVPGSRSGPGAVRRSGEFSDVAQEFGVDLFVAGRAHQYDQPTGRADRHQKGPLSCRQALGQVDDDGPDGAARPVAAFDRGAR